MPQLAQSMAVATAVVRASRWLALFCTLAIWLLPLAVAVYWVLADPRTLAFQAKLPPHALIVDPASWQRVAGAAVTEGLLAMALIGLWHARRCFRLFADGRVFTADAVACLRRFAGWIAAAALGGIVGGALLSMLLTLQNPPGARFLSIAVGTDQVFMAFFAGLVWLMASVIGQGRALAEENAGFV